VLVGTRVDELRGHTHPLSGVAHAAFDDHVRCERLRNLAERLRAPAISHHGRARAHGQGLDLRQLGDQFFVHAVREVFPSCLGAKRLERQDSDGDRRLRITRRLVPRLEHELVDGKVAKRGDEHGQEDKIELAPARGARDGVPRGLGILAQAMARPFERP
jgi:hypothetical protein